MRNCEKQMTLGELIRTLSRKDPDVHLTFDFVHLVPDKVHSYRGYYEDLAIGYKAGGESKVGEFLKILKDTVGKTFYGYKGGEYTMDVDTVVWVANHNECGGTIIVDVVELDWCIVLKTEKVE